MAAANESQGLKIAVAAFVSLTVIMAVTSYFLYSAYQDRDAKLTAADDKLRTAQKAQSEALNQYDDLRKSIGTKAEEIEPVKLEMKSEQKKIDDEIGGIAVSFNDAIGKMQAAGATGPELQDAKDKLQQIASAYGSEPNKTYISTVSRLRDLLKDVAVIDLEIARNYATLKRSLEGANGVNQQKLDVATKGMDEAKTDLKTEHEKHVSEREGLLTKFDQLQTENTKQANEIAALSTKLRELQEDSSKKLSLANQIIRELRDFKDAKETVLDRPDGYVTYVDHNRGEIRTNLTRGQGAKPQMTMSIFDRTSAGIPTEKPKGTIELVQVGETYSIARIVKTFNPIDPIRTGDIVHSISWSPNDPLLFALIGKIDINRDGKDDRADLIRMIEASGGKVDYDLPPPRGRQGTRQALLARRLVCRG